MENEHDHEHPCPSPKGCITYWRAKGAEIPDDTECCICWLRENM